MPAALDETKRCNKCGVSKSVSLFFRNRGTRDGRLNICKVCHQATWGASKRAYDKIALALLRKETIAAYGGFCFCCGESNIKLLTLDHSRNDGSVRGSHTEGKDFYRSLRREGFPQSLGLRVACWNCNSGRHHNNGICPHDEDGRSLTNQTIRLVA